MGGGLDDAAWLLEVLELPAVAPAPTEEGAAGVGSLARLRESQRFMTRNGSDDNDDNGCKFGKGGPPST